MEGKRIKIKEIGALIISILIAEGLGFIAGVFNRGSNIYYNLLSKPKFAPPSYLFGVIWPILYLLMALAAYMIWVKGTDRKAVRSALIFYGMQLLLNFLWPFVFFKLNLYGLSFLLLVMLIILVFITTFKFFKIDSNAGFLMLPYLLWLFYAAVLNCFIWLLNEA